MNLKSALSVAIGVLATLQLIAQDTLPVKELKIVPPIQHVLTDPLSIVPSVNKLVEEKSTQMETIPGDPFNTKIYTLGNGLKVYISVNKDAPRIQTLFAVKAGSKFDPKETTGLAHYLEHMLFKGTHRIGSSNWDKEKVLLDSVSNLFESHKNETNEANKKLLYQRIDSFSYEASKWAIPNEYDKMTTSMGALGTNAFTSTDMTVYMNDIPSNALDKFLQLESERFRTLVLRLFHTELETVYEEFNRNQDNDRVWSNHAIDKALLPNHPYGTQTTIGEGEHLKNPSMENIHRYFKKYYRPNNTAIILAGDINPDEAIALIEKYFGDWEPDFAPPFERNPPFIAGFPTITEYKGPMPEHVYLGFLFDGANSHEAMMVKLVDNILANGEAGLIDLNLLQQQKLLQGYSYVDENNDYVFHKFYGEPKQGQSLENVADLLLGEVEKIKQGQFGDWLLPAIIQNLKLQRMKQAESNDGRAFNIMGAFVHNKEWKDWVDELNLMEKVTKADIVKFVNERYTNGYAVCYKRQGDATVHKVEKPKITEVVMNKDAVSDYKKNWDELPQPPVAPKFIDFEKDITHMKLAGGSVPFDYIKNEVNKTFSLNYIFDMGTDHIRELGLAISYLEYLGTDLYTAEQLKTEFYKLGVSFSVSSGKDRVFVSLSGLEENLERGVQLFEHVLSNVKPDRVVYEAMVSDLLQKRDNAKKSKNAILFSGLMNYAKYGKVNPFNYVISADELMAMDVERLVSLIKNLSSYKHKVFYYGSREPKQALAVINKLHKPEKNLQDYPEARKFAELPLSESKVFFCNYPMKQTEIIMLAKDQLFNKDLYPAIFLYNDYYGSGLSSIMFQEIREKMALAYSVYSNFGVPQYPHESHYLFSYVGTQTDKLKTALLEMNKLLNKMPEVPQQFEGARESVVKTLETDWTTRENIYWAYDRALKRGLSYDVRKVVYDKAKNISFRDVEQFFNQHIKGKKYNYLIVGKKEDINFETLKEFGPVQEITLEELFGY